MAENKKKETALIKQNTISGLYSQPFNHKLQFCFKISLAQLVKIANFQTGIYNY